MRCPLLIALVLGCSGANDNNVDATATADASIDAVPLDAPAPKDWQPACDMTDSPYFTWTVDGGATIAGGPTTTGVSYTSGMHVDASGTIHISSNGKILRSTDRGCSFSLLDEVSINHPLRLVPTTARIYAWDRENIYRIENGQVTRGAGVTDVIAMGVDQQDPDRIVVVRNYGTSFGISNNGGDSYVLTTKKPPVQTLYTAAFKPDNIDTMLIGSQAKGLFRSTDGGSNWVNIPSIPAKSNVFSIAFNEKYPDVVWAMLIDLEAPAGQPNRWIYVSKDAGQTFSKVIAQDNSINFHLTNGVVLAPNFHNADQVYSVFNINAAGASTSYLYTIDANGTVTVQPLPRFLNVDSVGQAPVPNGPIFLGIGPEMHS